MNTYPPLLVFYGQPGAGKSYAAQIAEEQFGYYSYNADVALPTDMKKKILEKSDVTDHMRTRFVENIISEVKQLSISKTHIAVHQALIKKHMREQLTHAFPHVCLIWVRCNETLLKQRYMKRSYFNLGLEYLQVMIDAFEPPDTTNLSIDNNLDGPDHIAAQLKSLLTYSHSTAS